MKNLLVLMLAILTVLTSPERFKVNYICPHQYRLCFYTDVLPSAVRRAFKHRANHWYHESDSAEDDERTASAFRIGHRAGTAVLPPCSTP